MIGNLPTLLRSQNMQAFVSETKAQLDDARQEAVTGLAADVSKHLNGNVGQAQRIEKLINDNEGRADSIELLKIDFDLAYETLDVIRDASSSLATRFDAALGVENESSQRALRIEARAELEAMFGRLNTPFGDRQLFSGAATGTPPLGDVDTLMNDIEAIIVAGPDTATVETALDTYFDTAGGGFATNIYNGSTNAGPDREVAAGWRMGVTTRADDQMFKDAIRSLAVIAMADQAALSPEMAEELERGATRTLNSSAAQILDAQTLMGAEQAQLETLLTRNASETFGYTEALNTLIGVSQEEAATRMKSLETQLEASFLATARIAQLSLVNYLR